MESTMATLLIERSDPSVEPGAPCARCAGRPVWRQVYVHTFDLATGERCSSPALCCADCGAMAVDELDEAPAERARARAHSPASRGISMIDLLRDGPAH